MKICPKCLCPELATGHMCAGTMKLNEKPGQPPRASSVEIDHGPQIRTDRPVELRMPKPITGVECNFCGLTVKGKKLVAGPAIAICEDCIVLCADIVGYHPSTCDVRSEQTFVTHEAHVDLEARVTRLEERTGIGARPVSSGGPSPQTQEQSTARHQRRNKKPNT